MKILIVGNDPLDIGGVVNYTRPLAMSFSKLGHKVYYLYSGAWNRQYDWWLKPYLKIDRKTFSFECAGIVNSPNLPNNFGNPEIDISSPKIEQIVGKYIDKIKPDVMHIHSRLGLPFSINRIAYEKGVKVFNSIHVYGYICQKRVTTDLNGDVCLGPTNMQKCAKCTENQTDKNLLLKYRIQNTMPTLFSTFVAIKKIIRKTRIKAPLPPTALCNNISADYPFALAKRLGKRLRCGIDTLNSFSHKIICVSNDVKNTLMACGVKENNLLVQHIGSTIAEKQRENIPRKFHNPIVIGNIGGVNHYKGSHILIAAVKKIRANNRFILKIFGTYDVNYVRELMSGNEDLPIEFTGRYIPDELPEILKQIDIMVLPSICNDTAPQTIFESFSGLVPIVASNIGGFPDFITDGQNGCLFTPGNSADLAERLSKLIDNPEKIKSYQKNIPPLKTIQQNANELISLYSSYL